MLLNRERFLGVSKLDKADVKFMVHLATMRYHVLLTLSVTSIVRCKYQRLGGFTFLTSVTIFSVKIDSSKELFTILDRIFLRAEFSISDVQIVTTLTSGTVTSIDTVFMKHWVPLTVGRWLWGGAVFHNTFPVGVIVLEVVSAFSAVGGCGLVELLDVFDDLTVGDIVT